MRGEQGGVAEARWCVDERFLSPVFQHKALGFLSKRPTWAADLMVWLRDHLALDGETLSVIHGDYHRGNVMPIDNGSISGVLDWGFCIADPAVDLAHTMNVYRVLVRQVDRCRMQVCEQIIDGVLRLINRSGPSITSASKPAVCFTS